MTTLDVQAENMPNLFYGPEERVKWDDYLTAALCTARGRIAKQHVSPSLDNEQFRRELEDFDFLSPRPLTELLPWIIERLEHGIVQLTHPRYFGLFNPAPTFPAECAERIVAAFNPQLATATTSPIPVEIEAHVIRCVARRAGFPARASGHFTTGGTEANQTALVCALTRANPAFGQDGMHVFREKPTIYVSEDAHLAWHKIAHQVGLGRSAVRLVATDAEGRMDLSALVATIETDRLNGRTPVMIVATAGTTGAGMIDPLASTAEIASAFRAWFHVDAAWGGALIASDQLRCILTGLELADSATIDAHKWLATTMSCGMFITRHMEVLSDSFHATTNYMPSNNPRVDPYVTTAQWSRRFLGLRLFLSLAVFGWQGYAAHIERAIQMAELLKTELIARGWAVVNDSPLAVVCAEPPHGCLPPDVIARAVVTSGQAWVSSARFRSRDVVRMCITNGRTMPSDVRVLAGLLNDLSRSCTV
jgi:glutamate/tyrosine decarboxylase-like PLP-dependent enzyme